MINDGDISGAKIDLMIIGAPKSGTTSLHRYLGQHPQVYSHLPAEIGYFATDVEYQRGFAATLSRYYRIDSSSGSYALFGKSVKIMYSEFALRRLQEHNPYARVILVLRNPVDRAYSDFCYARRMGWESIDEFEAALYADPSRFGDDDVRKMACSYIKKGQYIRYIDVIEKVIGNNQFHVYLFEDLVSKPKSVCQSIFALFPYLDNQYIPDVDRRFNVGKANRNHFIARLLSTRSVLPGLKERIRRAASDQFVDKSRDYIRKLNEKDHLPPPMIPSTRAELVEIFRPPNIELSKYLNRDLCLWNEEKLHEPNH
jgi:hypothetical protein